MGIDIGDQLPDITVKSCDGTDYSLKELCGAQGLWIFAAHGWCPLCQSVSNNAESIHDGYAGQTLASVHIIVADAQNNPPDGPYCDLRRSQHGHEDVVTLYDPTGTILQLWPGGLRHSAPSSTRTVSSLASSSTPPTSPRSKPASTRRW